MHETDPSTRRGPRHPFRLVLIGLVGGLLSGLFGVGGGILMIPLLVTFLGMDQRRAATTSLVAVVPTATAGAVVYGTRGEIDVAVALVVMVGAVAGAFLGTAALRRINLSLLRWLFIALLLGIAIRMILVVPVRGEVVELDWVSGAALLVLGFVMGVASGLFGIGGGVLLVPVLVALFGSGDLVAKGTSLVVMLPTAVVGSVQNVRARIVDLQAGIVVGAAATVASVGGASLAFLLAPRLSTLLFVGLVLVSVVQLTVKELRQRRQGPGTP